MRIEMTHFILHVTFLHVCDPLEVCLLHGDSIYAAFFEFFQW